MVFVLSETIVPSASTTFRCWPTAVARTWVSLPLFSHMATRDGGDERRCRGHARSPARSAARDGVKPRHARRDSAAAEGSARVVPAASASSDSQTFDNSSTARRWRGSWRSHASNPSGSAAAGRSRVHAPDPRRRLFLDLRARAQFNDLAHSPLPLSATLRSDSRASLCLDHIQQTQLPQIVPTAHQAFRHVLLDGAIGDTEHLRDLGVRELVDLAQHEHASAQGR